MWDKDSGDTGDFSKSLKFFSSFLLTSWSVRHRPRHNSSLLIFGLCATDRGIETQTEAYLVCVRRLRAVGRFSYLRY